MFNIKDMYLTPKAFKKMYNLRLLKFYDYTRSRKDLLGHTYFGNSPYNSKVQFGEGLNEDPFDKLRSFYWLGYPLPTLSSNFTPKNLVELDLSYSSNLERLWEDTTHAPKLKWFILSGCPHLIEIPDLSKSPLLEKIQLNGCSRLTEIPDLSKSLLLENIEFNGCKSLLDFPLLAGHVKYLRYLNSRGCASLRSFPSNIHFESLESLDLHYCINLTTFPQISGNLHRLDLSGTAIDEVPPSIENLIQLYTLNLSKCTSLKHISTNICKLKYLRQLNLKNCSQLESFPEILDKMERLETLRLSGAAIKELPHSIEHLTKLSELYLRRCKNLESLPCSISNLISLKCLDTSDCPKLEIFPENLWNLKSLEDLSIDRIAISQLPSKQSCRGCRDLRFTDLPGLPCSSRRLYLNECNLKKIPEDIGHLSSLEFLELSGNNFESLPKSMKQLYKLTSLKVDNCNMLQSLTDLPSALKYLSASGCNMLQSLTELPSALKYLSVSGCSKLQSLTELPSALKYLSASGCKQLRSIPDASEFANLVKADFMFTNCLNLEETAVGNMLATLKEGYEGGIGELTFSCPGSKVPRWFMYRTEGSIVEYRWCQLNFQMPWHDCFNRPLLGFVVCAVIAFKEYSFIKGDLRVGYKYTCNDGDESSPNNITVASRNARIYGLGYITVASRNGILIDSDHIVFKFCKASVPRVRESDITNCSFGFWLSNNKSKLWLLDNLCRTKSVGVCPIYAKNT